MKAFVSQTLFANLATLPAPADTDAVTGKLPILKPSGYAEGEVHVADHDSNGWPQTPRNQALRALRRCFAVHIAGDQHLGSTLQYGIDHWNDASWAICTPAVSNIFPRRWYPAKAGRDPKPHSPRNTGEFLDGFGNRMTVHTVFNPQQIDEKPNPLMDRSPGYGIVEFDRATRKITMAVWPRREDASQAGAKPCPGWPVTINQIDNGFPHKGLVLETIRLMRRDLCVQVIRESTGEIVYTVRLTGQPFTLRVFEEGAYSVRVFDPDGDQDETRRVVGLLQSARGMGEPGKQRSQLLTAFSTQKGVGLKLRQILLEYQRQQELAGVSARLGELAVRQQVAMRHQVHHAADRVGAVLSAGGTG
jgi:hypothetical protein